MQAHREKKAKLANPNFFVSKTRYMYVWGIKLNGEYLPTSYMYHMEEFTCTCSSHRLSVRNLPTQVGEKQLKSLFLKAAGGPPAMIKQVPLWSHDLVRRSHGGHMMWSGIKNTRPHAL